MTIFAQEVLLFCSNKRGCLDRLCKFKFNYNFLLLSQSKAVFLFILVLHGFCESVAPLHL